MALAGTYVVADAAAVVDMGAALARVGLTQVEREYFWRGLAEIAKSTLVTLALVALVEVTLQDGEVLLELGCLMPVVHVLKVLQAEQVTSQKVVRPLGEGLLDELGIADRVVHQVQLSLQYQEIIESLMLVHHPFFMLQFDQGHLEVQLDTFEGSPADEVSTQVKLILGFVGHCNAFAGHAVVAEPFASVIA